MTPGLQTIVLQTVVFNPVIAYDVWSSRTIARASAEATTSLAMKGTAMTNGKLHHAPKKTASKRIVGPKKAMLTKALAANGHTGRGKRRAD